MARKARGGKRKPVETAKNKPARPLRGRAPGWLPFAVIVGLAAVLRISYTFASRRSPFFDHLDLDSRFYDLWAKKIAGGQWVGDEVFFMGPLYPYFLAVIYKVMGSSLVIVKIIQGLLGALTAGITYLLGRACFGPVAGIAAGFLAALYVPFIFYDNAILLPVLATLLNVSMLYYLCVGIRSANPRMFLLGGLVMGVSALGNASILAFGIPAVVFLLAYGKERLGRRAQRALLLAAGAAIVVIPVTIRNYAVGRDFVPITSNAGLNFYIGNHERAMGAYVKPEGLDVYTDPTGASIAETAEGRPLKPSEVSQYWSGRAWHFIRSQPGEFFSNLARKAFFFWSVFEVPQIEHLQFERRYSWILRIPSPTFGIVCPLGILGIALSLKRRKEAYLLFLFVLAYSLTIIAFFVVARYRLPMIPALLVFAGYTISWWIRRAGGRAYRALALSGIGFVALYVLVHANFYRVDPMSGFAQSYYRLGLVYEKHHEWPQAIDSYRNAVKADPSLAEPYVNLGILLSREKLYGEAADALRRSLELKPDYAKAYYNLGLVYAEEGKGDSALAYVDDALRLNPDYDLARISKAGLLYETARFDSAEALIEMLLESPGLSAESREQLAALQRVIPERRRWTASRLSDRQRLSDRWLLKGDDLLALGVTDRALDAFERAVSADTTSAVALSQAAALYFNRGDLERARRYYLKALRAQPGYHDAHFALGVIAFREGDVPAARTEFERELEVNPGSAKSHANLAMIYDEHLNDPAMAAYHLERYMALTGETPELRRHLNELKARANDQAN
jgi:tetratricopeptide (TPR) repeat protein